MDAKALAKSKRAHSSAKSKRPHRPSIPARTTPISLPSNWERYEDEEEDIAPGTVVPKSKGADYRHLLEESRSHANPSFDDELFDPYTRGIAENMLKVKGERITTWIENDNFNVDGDYDSTNFNVPLLSLNLLALSDQLKKVNLSSRLYIESEFSSSETEATAPEESDESTELTHLGEKSDERGSLKINSELDELMDSFEKTEITIKENPTDKRVGTIKKDLKEKYVRRTMQSKYDGCEASSSGA